MNRRRVAVALAPAFALLAVVSRFAAGQQDTTPRRPAQKLPATVVAEKSITLPQAFVRRMNMKGGGKFFTAPDLEKLNPPHTPALVARLTGGDVQEEGGTLNVITHHSGRTCVIPVFINDTRMPPGFDLRGIKPSDIVAMEVYSGPATIPLEMGGTRRTDANCGIVGIWIKERR